MSRIDGKVKHELSPDVQTDFEAALRCLNSPYDQKTRAKLADELLRRHCDSAPFGSSELTAILEQILDVFYPTQRVTDYYLKNLDALLLTRQPLAERGKVVLGMGTGRCGSTSLTMTFRSAEGALATHENPPMIFWRPCPEQVNFHMERLATLSRYFPLVFDAAHWWLNVVETFFQRFPEGRIVGLHRDTASCVDSFLKIKGADFGSANHWAHPTDNRWSKSTWDPSYPYCAFPPQYDREPKKGKRIQLQTYVEMYNERLHHLAQSEPTRVMLLGTDALTQPATAEALSKFVNLRVKVPTRIYNASCSDDLESVKQQHFYRF